MGDGVVVRPPDCRTLGYLTAIQVTYARSASPRAIGTDTLDQRDLAVFYYACSAGGVDCFNTPLLQAGFHPSEKDGRWSAGRCSLILLGDEASIAIKALHIEASAFSAAFRACPIDILTLQGLRGRVRIGRRKRYVVRLRKPWFKKSSRLVVGDFSEIETPHNVSIEQSKPTVSLVIPNYDRAYLTRLSAVAAASSLEKAMREALKTGADKDAASVVGKLVAERALAAGVSAVVFDRGPYLYHGRVKALADGAREGGLSF